jgi:ribonuclease HI
VAGARRIIFYPKRKEKNVYAWGVGKAYNNQAEALVMFQGIRIIDERQHRSIIVIRDPKLIIRSLRKGTRPGQSGLSQIFHGINNKLEQFEKVKFFHVLQAMNQKADELANMANTNLTKELFEIKGDKHGFQSLKSMVIIMIIQMVKSVVKENFGRIKPTIILNNYVFNGENLAYVPRNKQVKSNAIIQALHLLQVSKDYTSHIMKPRCVDIQPSTIINPNPSGVMTSTDSDLGQIEMQWEALHLQIVGNSIQEPFLDIFRSSTKRINVELEAQVGNCCVEDCYYMEFISQNWNLLRF